LLALMQAFDQEFPSANLFPNVVPDLARVAALGH